MTLCACAALAQVSSLAKDLQKGAGDPGMLHEVTLESLRNVLMVVTAEHVRHFTAHPPCLRVVCSAVPGCVSCFLRAQILEEVSKTTQKDMWGLTWAVIDAVCPDVRPTLASFGPATVSANEVVSVPAEPVPSPESGTSVELPLPSDAAALVTDAEAVASAAVVSTPASASARTAAAAVINDPPAKPVEPPIQQDSDVVVGTGES